MINNQIQVSKNSKIYIIAPGRYASGGPELLHQLSHNLNNLGLNSFIHYKDIANATLNDIPNEYKRYNVKVSDIEDNIDNILIVPEVMTRELINYHKIKIVIWWLSVDNHYVSMKNIEQVYFKNITFLTKICLFLKLKKTVPDRILSKIYNKNTIHLVQSHYAKIHLQNKNINSFFLSDYINESYYNTSNVQSRQNFILYNPAKGFENIKNYFVNEINGIWIPIVNMATANIIKLMKISKVYVDFGHHPGKDRLPREAALMGCIVITNKAGSAQYHQDVMIDDYFKIEDTSNFENVLNVINSAINNYDDYCLKFKPYRDKIISEKLDFIESINDLFINKNN